MNPTQIGEAGMGATAGGGILSAFGSISSGIANEKMFDYQASIARLNEQIDKQNATFASEAGEQQAFQSGLRGKQQMGQIVAAQGASGLDVNSGSAKQVQTSQGTITRLNSDVIRSNAAKTAYSYETQATLAGAQANVYQMAGANALEAGYIGAGSSVLGAASSVSSEWLKGQQTGLWGGRGGGGIDVFGGAQ